MIIIYFLQFILFVLFFVFPLGRFSLTYLKIKLPFWEALLIENTIGIVLLTLVAFISGIFGLGKFFYIVPITIFFLLLIKKRIFQNLQRNIFKPDLSLLIIISVTLILSGYFTFFSGDILNGRLRSIGGNTHDGLWHIALINNLKNKIPPENPIFSNTPIQNYHFLTDIFVAAASEITRIPVPELYFKVIEPFFIILLSGTIYIFLMRITGNKTLSYFGIILVLLSSNLFYIIRIFYPNAYFSPSAFWVDEFTTKLVNPQLLLSYIVILSLLYLIMIYEKIADLKFVVFISVISASLLGIKSYGAIVFLLSVALVSLFNLIKGSTSYIRFFTGLLLGTVVFYLMSNISRESMFILAPFWFIKVMFETTDHLAYPVWELKRQTYLEHQNYLRIGQLYFEGFLLFLLGNLGGRLIGLFAIFNKLEDRKKEICYLLGVINLVSLVLPMIFIQKGVVWNSIQFFYYSILSLSILSVIAINKIYQNHKLTALIVAGLIWITLLPGVFFNIINYYPTEDNFYGSVELLESASFLKVQKEGVVLVHPKYANDSFIPAFSGKTTFFADETILSIQLVDFNTRKKQIELFFSDTPFTGEDFLKQNDIKYILTDNNQLINLPKSNDKEKGRIRKIFTNKEITIYETL